MSIPWWGWLIIALACLGFVYLVIMALIAGYVAKRASKNIDDIHDKLNDQFDPWKF